VSLTRLFHLAAVLAGLGLLLAAGCDKMPQSPLKMLNPGVKEVEPWQVSACDFVGQVEGRALTRHAQGTEPLNMAKGEALKKAANLGATHLVWKELVRGPQARAVGRAYHCLR
jgi:hypothetical protein